MRRGGLTTSGRGYHPGTFVEEGSATLDTITEVHSQTEVHTMRSLGDSRKNRQFKEAAYSRGERELD